MCCKVLAIQELKKPEQEWCPHVLKKKGCGIYETRPSVCREFLCMWIDPLSKFPDHYRPDKLGAVFVPFDKPGGKQGVIAYVDRNRPGVIHTEPLKGLLDAIATRLQVLVSFGGQKVMFRLGKQWVHCDVKLDEASGKMDVFAQIPPVR